MMIPNLESSLVSTFGFRLYMLLRYEKVYSNHSFLLILWFKTYSYYNFRKNDLISPEELELPWRPLYDLCMTLMARKPAQVSFHHYPARIKNMLESLIYAAKVYFPVSSSEIIILNL